MKSGSSYKLMKGDYKPHKGAVKMAKFTLQKKHSKWEKVFMLIFMLKESVEKRWEKKVQRDHLQRLNLKEQLWQQKKMVKRKKRKFKKVPKTKKGVPIKYVAGAKNPKARESEIKRTARLYKEGKLTPAMMDKISKMRSKG